MMSEIIELKGDYHRSGNFWPHLGRDYEISVEYLAYAKNARNLST